MILYLIINTNIEAKQIEFLAVFIISVNFNHQITVIVQYMSVYTQKYKFHCAILY